ncbi:hypothetical protein [Caldimonas sp. KR1-144]|uniref:hypothetical protein n=1 Tax=Caldimonas sp. KR1-144 TaxID=3400911 RepID=UPI003C100693
MPNPSAADQVLMLQWLVGAAAVTAYAWGRFQKPSQPRPTTTFWRYWSAACGYVVAMLALYVMLGGALISLDLKSIAPLVEPLVGALPAEVGALPGPLLAALMLTSLLPDVPLLSVVDERIKRWFWRVGNIPIEARVLGAQLRNASFDLPAGSREAVQSRLAAHGAALEWLDAPAASVRARWARCLALLALIERWESVHDYARFADQHREELAGLRERVDALAMLLDDQTLAELDDAGGSGLARAVRRRLNNAEGDLATLWRALCDFVARGVLAEARSSRRRQQALAQMGFAGHTGGAHPLSSHDIVLVVGLIFLAMLFVPLMMRRMFVSPTLLPPQTRVLIMVPIVYAIAIVLAIYPKAIWPYARRVPGEPRPVAAYAVCGAAAALAAFAVSVLFRFAFDSEGNVLRTLATPGAFGKAWGTTAQRWPWLLMSFAATVAIAWAADDFQGAQRPPPRWLRWAESAALALVLGLCQWGVVELLKGVLGAGFAGPPERTITTAAVIGAVIGWLVPSMYRAGRWRVERAAASGTDSIAPQAAGQVL